MCSTDLGFLVNMTVGTSYTSYPPEKHVETERGIQNKSKQVTTIDLSFTRARRPHDLFFLITFLNYFFRWFIICAIFALAGRLISREQHTSINNNQWKQYSEINIHTRIQKQRNKQKQEDLVIHDDLFKILWLIVHHICDARRKLARISFSTAFLFWFQHQKTQFHNHVTVCITRCTDKRKGQIYSTYKHPHRHLYNYMYELIFTPTKKTKFTFLSEFLPVNAKYNKY